MSLSQQTNEIASSVAGAPVLRRPPATTTARPSAIPSDVSQRITVLRFPLIVGVMFIHAYGDAMYFSGAQMDAGSPTAALFCQNLISQVVARTAVPLFFLISGLLYFAGFEFSRACARRKLKSRLSTLIVPYLFWNAVTLAVLYALQSIPSLAVFFSGRHKLIPRYGAWDYVNAFIGYDVGPVLDQLWFIRDLLELVILAPALGFVAARWPKTGFAALLLLWLLNKGEQIGGMLSYQSLAFFFFGAMISLHSWNPCRLDRFAKPLVAAYAALALTDAVVMTAGSPAEALRHSPSNPFHLLVLLLGMAVVWVLAGRVAAHARVNRLLTGLVPYAFFVFVSHEPLLGGVKKLMYKALLPSTSGEVLLVYLLAPALVLTVTLACGWCFRRFFPKAFGIVTGGRL